MAMMAITTSSSISVYPALPRGRARTMSGPPPKREEEPTPGSGPAPEVDGTPTCDGQLTRGSRASLLCRVTRTPGSALPRNTTLRTKDVPADSASTGRKNGRHSRIIRTPTSGLPTSSSGTARQLGPAGGRLFQLDVDGVLAALHRVGQFRLAQVLVSLGDR